MKDAMVGGLVIFGYVVVHDYTVLYFHPCYHAILEQIFKY